MTGAEREMVRKSPADNFADWESHVFGFGYGTGEYHTLGALKAFLAAVGRPDSARGYDHTKLEEAVGATVAWLLINTLCHHRADIIEYGTSPRYGWLTAKGEALKAFVDATPLDDLVEMTARDEDYTHCSPEACNCGPNGYVEGRVCPNPFWGAP